MKNKAVNKWLERRRAQIHKGLCAHVGCTKKHVEENRCCKTHITYYRERNARYAARLKKGQVGK